MSELSESVIARQIWIKWGNQGLAAPNIHHFAFESDLLVLRPTGTLIEYEIKLTAADFKADFKKVAVVSQRRRASSLWAGLDGHEKMDRHTYLQSGLGANRFYYVLPDDLVECDYPYKEGSVSGIEIPEWAGIITCRRSDSVDHCHAVIKRQAKELHREKAGDEVKKAIYTSLYYRYWRNFAVRDLRRL